MALRPPVGALVAALALSLAALALLTARLLAPPARTVDLGAAGDAYLAASFFQPERAGPDTFRWSGPNSALALPAHAADGLILRARLHGAAAGQLLSLTPAGGVAATLQAGEQWRVYELLVAAPEAPHTLQLQAYPARARDGDPRELGVAIDWVHLAPLPRGPGAAPGALGTAALLIWGLGVVGAALLAARAAPQAPAVIWGTLGLVGVAAAALVAWAWADLDSLRWLLPLDAGGLAAASAAVGGLWLLRYAPWRPAGARRGAALRALLWPALLLGLAHVALWSPLPAAWRGAAALVILWTPGWLLVRLLLPHERDLAMGLALRVCGALALHVVLLLAASALPGGVSERPLLLICDLASAALAALLLRAGARPLAAHPRLAVRAAPWALVLLLAAALRLPALGAAELHDDEASVLLAAAELAQGRPEVLLTQLKGPAQILLPAGPLALTGQLSELTGRAAFAVAGLTVVLAAMAMARRLTGSGAAALVAGAVLAMDGLLIAFSRIVQYQSLVMAMGLGAFWCCWRFARGAPGPRRYLAAASLFTAVALLGHYDAIYVLPGLLWLVVAGARRRGWAPAEAARALAWPVALGAGLLGAFYVPFALHPHFAETLGHLGERTGQGVGWATYNNLGPSYELLTVYNTPAQIWLIAALLAALLLVAVARPRALTPGLWAALVWFAGAWLSMTFLIAQPRTHIYVAVIPAALLAAAGAGWLGRLRLPAPLRGALAAAALLSALWSGLHQEIVFLRQSPEYIRAYPSALIAPLPGGPAELPLDPAARFGFPARDGWKAVGELYQRGELSGAAASNQSSEVLAWYMRGQRRCGADAEVYLIALSAPNPAIPQGYYRTATVQADGRDQLGVYQRVEPPDGPRVVPLEPLVAPFDERPIPPAPGSYLGCE